MSHYYEKNIVEIKNEYTDFLLSILTPLLFEGIKSIYEKAVKLEEDFRIKEQQDPSVKNPGVFKLFQICLRDIPNLNTAAIENETNRIKEKSRCSEYFDSLLKSVIKSNIILLTFNSKKKKSHIVEERFHESIDSKLFVHKCYIESSRIFFNYPELFCHHFSTLDIKRNQREIYDLIKDAIKEAIRKSLPIKLILDEYLKNDYDYEDDIKDRESEKEEKFIKIKKLLDDENRYDELSKNSNNSDKDEEKSSSSKNSKALGVQKIIDSEEQEEIEKELNNIESQVRESERLESEVDELVSHISNTVCINNLILDTSADDENYDMDSINKVENITKVNKLATIPENDAFKLVKLKETSKKKNEASFFKDEMERYNLNKAKEAIKKQQEVYSEVEVKKSNNNMELGDLSEVEVKKNNKVNDKNDFFNNMMK